jgi:redox-sensing transcriptional repressor
MIKDLPPNTVERLSLYRRKLKNYSNGDKKFIHSHQLAHLLRINPAHIRRDLMLIKFTGDVHKGYNIQKLINRIGEVIDQPSVKKVAFIGMGDLGRAVAEYFISSDSKIQIAATFRMGDEPKKQFEDVSCYNISKLKDIIRKEKIELCVLAVPSANAIEISKSAIDSGIKGILNFTSVNIDVPENVYIEDYDMIAILEKMSYFAGSINN